MNDFSLSRSKASIFPEEVLGTPVNADFRNILKILRLIADPLIPSAHKPRLILKLFYKGEAPPNGINGFIEFVAGSADSGGDGGRSGAPSEQAFDYEFDAKEIYASFLSEYGIDLLETGFLHWRGFLAALACLPPESALGRKIQTRFMDLKNFKGSALLKAMAAKEAARIPERYSYEELREIAEFKALWENVGGAANGR